MDSASNRYLNNPAMDNDETQNSQGSGMEQLDLQHYLRILRKHKWPVTLFTAAVTGFAAYYAMTATPIYKSTSTLLIESQGTEGLVDFKEIVGVDTQNQDYYQTQYELLRSRGLAQRVVNRLDLWNNPEYSPDARASEAQSEAARREVLGESPSGIAGLIERGKGILGVTPSENAESDNTVNSEPVKIELASVTQISR